MIDIIERLDYKTIEGKTIKSHGTFKILTAKIDSTKNLLFSMHVRTSFFDKDDKYISCIYTKDFPENVEIYVPEETVYIRTVYHRESTLNIEECEKTDNALKAKINNQTIYHDFNNQIIYVDDFDFCNDGSSDNSDKLLELEKIIDNNENPYRDCITTIVFGAGTYLFTKSNLNFLGHKIGNCVFGLDIKGQGASTIIKYEPEDKDADNYFIANYNSFASINFSDFLFYGKSDLNVSFCKQVADPFPQHVSINRVTFSDVDYCFDLKASDCNSEFSFYDCKWRGKCSAVLNGKQPGISTQMLNYWFYSPDFQCTSGSLIDLDLGGNISIINGNFIHKSTSGGNIVSGGTFFKLGGDMQQFGICRFLCIGARFECSTVRNSNIIESNWGNKASISFINCDDTAKALSCVEENNLEECKFIITKGMPKIKFQDCMLHGKHVYDISNSVWEYSVDMNNVCYDNCIFAENLESPYDMLKIIGTEKIIPKIKFINLEKKFSAYENTYYAENIIHGLIRSKKYINIKNDRGVFPITKDTNGFNTIIPKGSLITGIILYAPQYYSSATNKNDIDITLEDINILSVKDGIERDGLIINKSLFIPVTDNNIINFKRKSTFPGKEPEKLIALIEYI